MFSAFKRGGVWICRFGLSGLGLGGSRGRIDRISVFIHIHGIFLLALERGVERLISLHQRMALARIQFAGDHIQHGQLCPGDTRLDFLAVPRSKDGNPLQNVVIDLEDAVRQFLVIGYIDLDRDILGRAPILGRLLGVLYESFNLTVGILRPKGAGYLRPIEAGCLIVNDFLTVFATDGADGTLAFVPERVPEIHPGPGVVLPFAIVADEIAIFKISQDRLVVIGRQCLLLRFLGKPRTVSVRVRRTDGLHGKFKEILSKQLLYLDLIRVGFKKKLLHV